MFLAEGLVALIVVLAVLGALLKVLFPKKRGRHATARVPVARPPRRAYRDEFEDEPGGFWSEDEEDDENCPPLVADEEVPVMEDALRTAVMKTTNDAAHSGSFPVHDEPGAVLFTPRAGTVPVSDATTSFGVLRDGDTRKACEIFGHLFTRGKCRDCHEDVDNIAWPPLANVNRTKVEAAGLQLPGMPLDTAPGRSEAPEVPDDPETVTLPVAS